MKKSSKIIISLLCFVLVMPPISVFAEFDPNYIISDKDMVNFESMNLGQIQKFLEEKGGTLSYYTPEDRDGSKRRASEIIYLAAINNEISPKALLVMLQKEQSLVNDPTPVDGQYDWAMGYAVCDGCNVNDAQVARFKGFPKQVNSSAAQIRYYMDNPDEFKYKPNNEYIIDNYYVTPQNQATASLYNYTPHITGNANYNKIWSQWFGQKYPDGSLLKIETEEGKKEVWYIQNGKKRKIASAGVLLSRFDIAKVLDVNKEDLDSYSEAPTIKFPNFSLLQSPKGNVYLLVNDTIRGLASESLFKKLGYSRDEVEKVTWEDLDAYEEGAPITKETLHPTGSLLQNNKTGGVYYVQDGEKFPIWSKTLLLKKYNYKKITAISPEDLDKFKTGSPVTFDDGEIITSEESKSVYVISNGQKRPVSSAQVFNQMGYKWENIITVSQKILDLHPTGSAIN